MLEIIKKNKVIIMLVIFLIVFIILTLAIREYQYNKCVRINKEESEKCKSGEFDNYDCSVFENTEELCSYRY